MWIPVENLKKNAEFWKNFAENSARIFEKRK